MEGLPPAAGSPQPVETGGFRAARRGQDVQDPWNGPLSIPRAPGPGADFYDFYEACLSFPLGTGGIVAESCCPACRVALRACMPGAEGRAGAQQAVPLRETPSHRETDRTRQTSKIDINGHQYRSEMELATRSHRGQSGGWTVRRTQAQNGRSRTMGSKPRTKVLQEQSQGLGHRRLGLFED